MDFFTQSILFLKDKKVLRRSSGIQSSGRRRLGPINMDSEDSDDMISLRTPKYLPIETSPFVTCRRGSMTGENSVTKIEETPTSPIKAKSNAKQQSTPLRKIDNLSTPKTPRLNTPKGPVPLSVARSPFFSSGKNVMTGTPKTPFFSSTKTPTFALRQHSSCSKSPFADLRNNSENITPSSTQKKASKSTPSTSKQITTPYQSPNQFSSPYHSPSINYDSNNDDDVAYATPTSYKTPRSTTCLRDEFQTPIIVDGKMSFLASLSLDEPTER
jgi:hypothetical protein